MSARLFIARLVFGGLLAATVLRICLAGSAATVSTERERSSRDLDSAQADCLPRLRTGRVWWRCCPRRWHCRRTCVSHDAAANPSGQPPRCKN